MLDDAPSTVHLPSQASFAGGAFACTAIVWHWAMAVIEGLIPATCTLHQYAIVCKVGIAAHAQLSQALPPPAFLNSAELADYFAARELRSTEFGLYSADIVLETSMRLHAMHVDTLLELVIQPVAWTYALFITYKAHTTALVSTHDAVVLLDSMPARLSTVPRASHHFAASLRACLKRVLPADGMEGTAMLVRK